MTWVIKSKPDCPWCEKAKVLLAASGEQVVEQSHETPAEIANFKAAGWKSFPQVFRNGKLVGSYTDLVEFLNSQETF